MTIYKSALLAIRFQERKNYYKEWKTTFYTQKLRQQADLTTPNEIHIKHHFHQIHSTASELQELDTNNSNGESNRNNEDK